MFSACSTSGALSGFYHGGIAAKINETPWRDFNGSFLSSATPWWCPPTLQSAFQLPASALITLTQYGFITTGAGVSGAGAAGATVARLWRGPTGLWWSTILTVAVGEAARGTAFDSIAASLAVGIFLSAVLTIIIGRQRHRSSPGEALQPDGDGLFLCCCSARSSPRSFSKACSAAL
ncbi:Xanthine-uracil permease [Klebsiella grimontii]|uniref:Xanthine-uracil permease n=1 Tax=Klebsiella grimontii TaxID=2058152 RepID=A0A7H4P8N6_9ENTR|nr:Xanthine-uracil permease [Klebsiella grimontii]